jgi:hypothetical protein
VIALAVLLLFTSYADATSTADVPSHDMAWTEAQKSATYDLWLARHDKAYNNALGGGEYDCRF